MPPPRLRRCSACSRRSRPACREYASAEKCRRSPRIDFSREPARAVKFLRASVEGSGCRAPRGSSHRKEGPRSTARAPSGFLSARCQLAIEKRVARSWGHGKPLGADAFARRGRFSQSRRFSTSGAENRSLARFGINFQDCFVGFDRSAWLANLLDGEVGRALVEVGPARSRAARSPRAQSAYETNSCCNAWHPSCLSAA